MGQPNEREDDAGNVAEAWYCALLSRSSVGDDNPYSESFFRMLKYTSTYPNKSFESLEAARNGCTALYSGTTVSIVTVAYGALVRKDSKLESGGGSLPESAEGTSGGQGPKLQGCLINGRDNFIDKHWLTRRDAYPGYLPKYASEMTGYLGPPSDLTLFQGVDSGWWLVR